MKRLLISLIALALAGFGCAGPVIPAGNTTYENPQYGFAFSYPKEMDVRSRDEGVRQTTYIGLPADFFASVRDVVRDSKPTNVFYLYAMKDVTVDTFKDALVKSGAGIEITSAEETKLGEMSATKITSTTEAGEPKYHYLVPVKDALLIVSVFLNESAVFDPIGATFRSSR